MSEIGKGGSQKVVGRNVAIVLGIICIILGGLLGGSIYNYTSIISSKDSQIGTLMNQSDRLKSNLEGNITYYSSQIASLQAKISDLQNQMSQKETQITGLQNQISEKDKTIAEMNTEISNLKIQITNLQSQIDTLKAPKLIGVDLRVEDVRPWLQTPYLHVYGYVCNVGKNTAYDSKIHVVLYQSGGVIAKETDIILGAIPGESYVHVDVNVYYTGSPIVNNKITLYWQGGETQYSTTTATTTVTTRTP
jgi:archaellum component FlaC